MHAYRKNINNKKLDDDSSRMQTFDILHDTLEISVLMQSERISFRGTNFNAVKIRRCCFFFRLK